MPGPLFTNDNTIPVRVTHRVSHNLSIAGGRNPTNYTAVKTVKHLHTSPIATFRMCLLNMRSVREKGLIVKDFPVENDLDALILAETWLRPGNVDAVAVGTLCPTGYRFIHGPRISNTSGGGIGFLFKETLDVNSNVCDNFETFEIMHVRLKSTKGIRILCVYRPPDVSSYALFSIRNLVDSLSEYWLNTLVV